MNYDEYEAYQAQLAMQQRADEYKIMPTASHMHEEMNNQQAILVNQVNPKRVFEEIILTLRGKELDRYGQEKIISEPIINELGISRIRFIMSGLLNQSNTLSHVESTDISKATIQVGEDLTDDLALNWKKYGIKDKSLLDNIEDAILIPIFFALKRAEGQNEKNWLGKITLENVSAAPRIQPKKEGFWNKLRL